MTTPGSDSLSWSARVLILAPLGRDSAVLGAAMREAGLDAFECQAMADVCVHADEGAGALLFTHEALTAPAQSQLLHTLARQPQWSAMPVVILTQPHSGVGPISDFLAALGPVGTAILVERPIKPSTLQSVLRMVLLARERQYQLRGYLDEISRQGVELAQHRDNLQALVQRRTEELAASMRSAQDAQRLAALGNMAAGIGHDIANMTLPIRARLEPLAAACNHPEARDDIAAIGKSLDHLSNLSAGLRLMALDPTRDNASSFASNLTQWGDHADGVLRNALPRGVGFELRVDARAAPLGVAMPSHRLTQVIFNLVQNAGEAIAATGAANGLVRVDFRELPYEVPHAAEPAAAKRPVIEVVVTDNGPGIPPEHIAHIFEPYFTTKGRTIATGMGLGMVRGLIESAGGTVRVDSQPGHGATFTLTLPAVADPAATAGSHHRRTAVVTLADPRQKAVVEAILTGLNVEVIRARDGAAARPSADLCITDMSAPAPGPNGSATRVHRIPAHTGLAAIRNALVAAVRDLANPIA